MKTFILPLALALAAGAVAEDEWVSVGANRSVAPAQPDVIIPSSSVAPPATGAGSSASVVDVPSASGDLLSELLMQIEQMQQEIAMLRSQVESQQQMLSSMEQDQQARYLDLDRRVASLLSQPVNAAVTPADNTDAIAAQSQVSAADAYKAAMNLVRDKQFAEANQAFTAFVQNYPGDELVANAWYWNGEVYLVQSKFAQAKVAFNQVVTQFAEHQKAADATYKLGVTEHKLGNDVEARRWLNTVIERFSGKADTTVRLAKSYLDKLPTPQ